jgi:hypothetical protein
MNGSGAITIEMAGAIIPAEPGVDLDWLARCAAGREGFDGKTLDLLHQ